MQVGASSFELKPDTHVRNWLWLPHLKFGSGWIKMELFTKMWPTQTSFHFLTGFSSKMSVVETPSLC